MKRPDNLAVNLLFTLSAAGFAGFSMLMRDILYLLMVMTLAMTANAPVMAEQTAQSGTRVQVRVSAHIVSGETVRLDSGITSYGSSPRLNKAQAPLVRTRGMIMRDGRQNVRLTEFH